MYYHAFKFETVTDWAVTITPSRFLLFVLAALARTGNENQ